MKFNPLFSFFSIFYSRYDPNQLINSIDSFSETQLDPGKRRGQGNNLFLLTVRVETPVNSEVRRRWRERGLVVRDRLAALNLEYPHEGIMDLLGVRRRFGIGRVVTQNQVLHIESCPQP